MVIRLSKVSDRPHLLLFIAGALALAALGVQLGLRGSATGHLIVPVLVVTGLICFFRWWQITTRAKEAKEIREHLENLPDDFEVLHDLDVPSGWGYTHVDHVILSRFGVVVALDGPLTEWVVERTEAVRSFLIGIGAVRPSAPVRSLVLLPPGGSRASVHRWGAPIVGVEEIRTHHLAPMPEPVFSRHELATISECLRQME